MTERASLTVDSLIDRLLLMRAQGWGGVEVAIDDGHGCCGHLCLTGAAVHYPAAQIQIAGSPSQRPVIIMATEGGWQ